MAERPSEMELARIRHKHWSGRLLAPDETQVLLNEIDELVGMLAVAQAVNARHAMQLRRLRDLVPA